MTRITGTLHEGLCIFVAPRCILLRMRNVSDKSCRENCNTLFMFNNLQKKKKLCRVWDDVEKFCRAVQATDSNVRRMRFRCWITKGYKRVFRTCNAYWFYTAAVATRRHFSVMFYLQCLSWFVFLFYGVKWSEVEWGEVKCNIGKGGGNESLWEKFIG